MRLVTGPLWKLEDRADAILAQARRDGIPETAFSILNDKQMACRQDREVLNDNGHPDVSIRSGVFGRVFNPFAAGNRKTFLTLADY